MKFSRLPLLSAVALSFFAFSTYGQSTDLPNLSDALSSQAESKTAKTGNTDNTSGGGSSQATKASSSGPSPTAKITATGSATPTTETPPPISITGGATGTDDGALINGPTLSGAFKIVPPTVPPTADAPFMRVSSLPEGTVFIVVGAILGFLAMSVILWRGLVAWSLHRSVKRAALMQNMSDTKALFRTPAAPMYSYKDRESTISLGNMGHKSKKSARPTTAPGVATQASLFFSPTAGAVGQGMTTAGHRGSNYLPSGYYAAGASQPGNGNGMAHIGNGPSISLSNLGPQRDGYMRAQSIAPSPPGSPAFRAHGHTASSSSLNLNQVPGDQRAPSMYLDDLFDSEGGPVVPGQHQYGGQPRF